MNIKDSDVQQSEEQQVIVPQKRKLNMDGAK